MAAPEMKQVWDIAAPDFDRHPLWIGVNHHDVNEPWFKDADDQTFRPWTGPFPFASKTPFSSVLVAAKFELADGSSYPGYFNPVREDWDAPLPPRRRLDGSYSRPLQWSARRGQTALSVLALHCPVIFIEGKPFDFHLRRHLNPRKDAILSFYAALGKRPSEVFPIHFSARSGLTAGISVGRMDGFYSFPLDKPFEIDTGERFLDN